MIMIVSKDKIRVNRFTETDSAKYTSITYVILVKITQGNEKEHKLIYSGEFNSDLFSLSQDNDTHLVAVFESALGSDSLSSATG